jgi:hypothetical protein
VEAVEGRRNTIFTMRLSILTAVVALSQCSAFSLNDAKLLSQKSVVRDQMEMVATQRDPMRMPTSQPMVPYMVCEISLSYVYSLEA